VVLALTVIVLLAGVASSTFYRVRRNVLLLLNRPLVRRLDRMQEFSHLVMLRLEALEDTVAAVTPASIAADRVEEREGALRLRRGALEAQAKAQVAARRKSMLEEHSWRAQDQFASMYEEDEVKHLRHEPSYEDWTDAYTYAACAGAIGACSVILAGCTSKTLIMAFDGYNQFDQIAPYAFICGMIFTITGQQLLLNAALELGPIMTVFPIFQAFFIGFGVVGGIVFYQTGDSMSSTVWTLHWLSAALMLAGCACLMKHGKEFWAQSQIKALTQEEVEETEKAVHSSLASVHPAAAAADC